MRSEKTYRFKIFETEDKGYLFIAKSHVVSDGMSRAMMLRSMAKAFCGQPLPLDTYYSYLAKWNEGQKTPQVEEDRKYYHGKYDGIRWTYNITADEDTGETGGAAEMRPVKVSQKDIEKFQKVTGLSTYYLCLMSLLLAIAKQTGKKDIITGYTYNNRNDKAKANALGLVCKSLPLGIRLGQYTTVKDMIDDIKMQTIENVKHIMADYVVDAKTVGERVFSTSVETEEILDGNPFAVMGIHEEHIPTEKSEAPSELMLLLEFPGNLMNLFSYERSLYKKESMEAFFATYDHYMQKLVKLDAPEIMLMDDFMKE